MCLYSIDRGESSFTPMVRGEKFVCGTSYSENRTEDNVRKSIPLIDDEDALFQNKVMPKIIKIDDRIDIFTGSVEVRQLYRDPIG